MKKLFMILILVGAVGLSGCHATEGGRVRADLYGSYGYSPYGRVYGDPIFYPPYYYSPYYSPFFFSSGFFFSPPIHHDNHVVIGDHGGFRPGRSLRGGTLGHRRSGSHGGAGSHGGLHGGGHR